MSAEAPGPPAIASRPGVRDCKTVVVHVRALHGRRFGHTHRDSRSIRYDAIAHGLTTIATGGFSPHADSIGTFDSGAVELAIIVGMVLGGTNFALHWRAVTGDRLAYWRDPEFRTYLNS